MLKSYKTQCEKRSCFYWLNTHVFGSIPITSAMQFDNNTFDYVGVKKYHYIFDNRQRGTVFAMTLSEAKLKAQEQKQYYGVFRVIERV
jgi:outer membrane protein assembly factor BamE (lipoprotein component of BamABCDE complex)